MGGRIATDIVFLKYYTAICEERSLSGSAKKLFISKQALSAMLKKMEEELGTPLLERTRSGAIPTPAGEVFYRHAAEISARWSAALGDMESLTKSGKRLLRVGLGYFTRNYWTPEINRRFSEQHPELTLKITSEPSADLLRQLKKGELDLVITGLHPEHDDGVFQTPVLKERIFLAFPENDPLASHEAITPALLSGRTVLSAENGRSVPRAEHIHSVENFPEGCRYKTIPSGNILQVIQTVLDEREPCAFGEFIASHYLAFSGLTCRPFVSSETENRIFNILRAVSAHPPEKGSPEEIFIDYLRNALRQECRFVPPKNSKI